MLNAGLLEKAYRECRAFTWILGGALTVAAGLLAYVLPTFQNEIAGAWTKMPIVRDMLRALLGSDIGDRIGPHVFLALPWVHPIVLTLIWAHQMTYCSRIPAGEIDRGTVDVLFGLPVSRWEIFLSETVVFLACGVVLLSFATVGNWCGSRLAGPDFFPGAGRVAIVLTNAFCLYLAVGGAVFLFSSLTDRRGRAIGWGIAVVLGSFLLNFLAEFWEPAKTVSFLSLLSYYQPAFILRDGHWPLGDLAVLSGLGLLLWISAGFVLQRRDVCTV